MTRLSCHFPRTALTHQAPQQMPQRRLVSRRQPPERAQQTGFICRQAFQRRRSALPAEHIQRIHALGRQRCQVIRPRRALATFVFALSVGFDAADITKYPLGHAQPFTLFSQPWADSFHMAFSLFLCRHGLPAHNPESSCRLCGHYAHRRPSSQASIAPPPRPGRP